MKRQLCLFCLATALSTVTYANWFQDIIDTINKQSGMTNNILGNSLSVQRDLLGMQQDIQRLMGEMNNNMIGHSGWGTYQFHDYQSYGGSSADWSNVMNMARDGQGDGQLGRMMSDISNQFPMELDSYNKSIRNSQSQKYYALKSKTVLAARAASQLDYNRIQEQIAYQQMLQQQIEKTDNLKAAMDLSNRIQVEGNLINLEMLRQVALSNQQQAITEQATVNAALTHAKFLTK